MYFKKRKVKKAWLMTGASLIGLILAACSNEAAADPAAKEQVETEKIEKKAEEQEENVAEDKSVEVEQPVEQGKESYSYTESLTIDDFIHRWEQHSPGAFSLNKNEAENKDGSIQTLGFISGEPLVIISDPETNYIESILFYAAMDDRNNTDDSASALFISTVDALIDVLEPYLKEGKKEQILKALDLPKGHELWEVSARAGDVKYIYRTGDDRFSFEATFKH